MILRKVIKGLIFLLVGLILLANTLGILDWNIWYNVVRLWPLLLISAGISIIFRDRKLSFFGPLIIFIALIVGIGLSYSGIDFIEETSPMVKTLSREMITVETENPEEETVPVSEPSSNMDSLSNSETPQAMITVPDIKKTNIDLNFNMGTLSIGEPTSLLYECISKYNYESFEPFEKYSHTGENASITIFHSPVARKIVSRYINHWQLKLNKDMVYDLQINTGALNAECNFSDFKIDELLIDSGASNIDIVIPEYNSNITIDTGVSNIELSIPDNVGTIVMIDSGIAIKNLNKFTKENNRYISHNYDESEYKTEISIDSGISNIEINYLNSSTGK